MNVLLTGANGFLGKFLVGYLPKRQDIRLFPVYRSKAQLNQAFGPSVHPLLVEQAFEEYAWETELRNIDVVIHAAGKAHVAAGENDLPEFRRVNVDAALNLARRAARAGVKRFVFISSIGVNGNGSDIAYTEQATPNPSGAYAISKYEAELALLKLAETSPMEIVIIRPPLIYGPDAPGNFAQLVRAVSKGVPLPFGMINNRRTLVGIDNLASLIHVCLSHPGAANQIFLAADAETVSTTELLRTMAEGLGKKSRLVPVPLAMLRAAAGVAGKKDVIDKICGDLAVDIGKARRLLGWHPPLSFREAMLKSLR